MTHYKNQGRSVIAIEDGKERLFGQFHKGDKSEQAKNFCKNLNILNKMPVTEEGEKGKEESRKYMQDEATFNMDGATKDKYDI